MDSPNLARKKVIFHEDNACLQAYVIAMAKINELWYELLPHSIYSCNMALSDFHFFPKLKIFLDTRRFSLNEELIARVAEHFACLEETNF